MLQDLRITHIVVCAASIIPSFPDKFSYHVIPINDVPEARLLPYLEDAFKFIDEGRTEGNVLVHWYEFRRVLSVSVFKWPAVSSSR
jgi:hypothetical protein